MSVWRFADQIDFVPECHRITLGEGNTPLVRSRRLGLRHGLERLYFKLESINPTGSYKDRFAAVAISDMLARGKHLCLATSSGNTGAALAGYCAVAGLRCTIVLVEKAPAEKLQQMQAYGAQLHKVKGFGQDPMVDARVYACLERLGQLPHAATQISAYRYSPVGMTGVQTIAYELAEQLPGGCDHVFVQAGGGGMVVALERGFARLGVSVAVDCVQPVGNDTIATPLRTNATQARRVACTTRISGLQVPDVIDGHVALTAARRSGGTGHVVSDEEVWQVQADLAREEGIFTEPAGAVAVAGALRASREGILRKDCTVVCLVTSIGFKDRGAVERMVGAYGEVPVQEVAVLEERLASECRNEHSRSNAPDPGIPGEAAPGT